MSYWEALKSGDLRPNDLRFLSSMGASIIFWIILNIVLLAVISGPTGAIASLPLLYVGILAMLIAAASYQSRAFKSGELIMWVIMNILYLAGGFAFFFYYFNVSKFKLDVTKRDLK